jgi:hypothetical protein
LTAVAALVAGCAQAGSPNQAPVDAPGTSHNDAPREAMIDAPAMTQMDAPMMGDSCTSSVTCATATTLAGIGGDEDGASESSATGYQSAWYSIRISETDSGPFADPMSMQTTLTSPSGAMFDLLVYVPGDNSSTDCTSPSGSIQTSGSTETSTLEWGETGITANGDDDSRTVTIQISPHTAGETCSSSSPWSLSIITGFD